MSRKRRFQQSDKTNTKREKKRETHRGDDTAPFEWHGITIPNLHRESKEHNLWIRSSRIKLTAIRKPSINPSPVVPPRSTTLSTKCSSLSLWTRPYGNGRVVRTGGVSFFRDGFTVVVWTSEGSEDLVLRFVKNKKRLTGQTRVRRCLLSDYTHET